MEENPELPGLYEISGIEMEMRIPKTNEIVRTKVPLSHIAYNVIIPRVGKRIDPENYRRKISDCIRSVEMYEDEVARKYPGGTIKIPRNSHLNRLASHIGSELGHAFSDDILVPDVDTPINRILWEYYDFLGKMIAKDEFGKTKYKFESPKLYSVYKNNFLAVRHSKYISSGLNQLSKKKFSRIEHIELARKKVSGIKKRLGSVEKTLGERYYGHFVGYNLGDIIGGKIGYENSFTEYNKIFDLKKDKENEILCLKEEILKKFSGKELKRLWRILDACAEYTTLYLDQEAFILGAKEDLENYEVKLNEKEKRIRNKISSPTFPSGSLAQQTRLSDRE